MPTFGPADDLQGARFHGTNLGRARFVGADLGGVVMRGVDLAGADLDAPWLTDGASRLLVNGVDVAPLVEAELNGRFPGRADRRADRPETVRAAWAGVERAWADAVDRVATMPPGTVEVAVDGEWSFVQTLRHLVFATDVWLVRAVLHPGRPFHPLGLPNPEAQDDGVDPTGFLAATPAYADVLEVRASHQGMVRDFLATATAETLAAGCAHPWDPQHTETALGCVHVILEEEWEHLRYAVRDLDVLQRAAADR